MMSELIFWILSNFCQSFLFLMVWIFLRSGSIIPQWSSIFLQRGSIIPHNGAWYSSEEAQLSHIGAQYSSEEAQLSKDSSKFSSYEAYVLPNYGVSAGKRVVYEVSASVRIGYHASSNHVGIPQKFVVSFDLKAE